VDKKWYLESFAADGSHVNFEIETFPCLVGRGKNNDLVIDDLGLSRLHAIISRDISGRIRISDENSTNGTFVNRQRIHGYSLASDNDIIHFASVEYKLRMRTLDWQETSFDQMHTMLLSRNLELSERFVTNEAEFEELIMGHGMSGAAQPIVDAHTRSIIGYELLGRSSHPSLPNTPIELFMIAEALGRELDLSLAFREYSINQVAPLVAGKALFINVHPKETFSEFFLTSLETLRRTSPDLNIVVEIHETAVTDLKQLRTLVSRLTRMGVRFAYDDFGAGQARLLEIADHPAHFVKFDRALIRGLHNASERKRQVVRNLVQLVLEAGSVPLAEGVEDEREAQACIDMGFQLIQGYLTGRPIPAHSLPR